MNPFATLQNDTVYIENLGSDRSGPYKTDIGTKGGLSASIFKRTLDVEEGWKLIRPLPNGKEESYTILEANYNPGLLSIPPSWNLKLRKDSSLKNRQPAQKKTTINISNSQGIQVGDHNTQTIESGLNELIQTITSSESSAPEKEEALGVVKSLINNPIVAGVLGGATSGLLALLG
ncbi:MAG: hypothetical protein ACI83W_002732 [Marinoscillum sp.]|jgi:hypothetical protein